MPEPDHDTAAITAVPPPEVSRAAEDRGFGVLEGSRALPSPWLSAAIYLFVGVLCFTLLTVVANLAPSDRFTWLFSILRFVGFFVCLLGVGFVLFAIKALVQGARAWFVYHDGIVYRHNGRVRSFAWSEVTMLRAVLGTRGASEGKLMQYNLEVADGRPVAVPLHIVDGRDAFLDCLMAALQRADRPVR